ncbi:hypothetical protein Pfo_013196 [Paulownia fortunei]|nr:hypothetical protein Pfo_013196 [Paulownia fortunei]
MEGEMNNFMMVWSSILMSACYCYGISKLVPKGTIRFFMFLPVLCLFLLLPLYLNSVNLVVPTAFFATWLTTFKLLLLVFGTGPLSYPSLSLFHFVLIFCLPIKLQQATSPKSPPLKDKKPPKKTWNKENLDKSLLNDQKGGHQNPNSNTYKICLRSLLHIAKKGLIFILLIGLGSYKDKFPRDILWFLICIYTYIGIEVLLGVIAIIGQVLLGAEVEPPFDEPYLSTSLQDFWGRRWNRVASSSLRSAVFDPTRHHTSRVLGRKWAAILALLVTFVVSDLMHEIIFYYLGRVRSGWGTPLFFLVQGLCVVIESMLKRKIDARWRLPQIIMGPLIFGFVICTFMWLVLPELLEHNVDDRALDEYAAVGAFVMDLGLAWSKMGYTT